MYDISAANIIQLTIKFSEGNPLTFEQEDFSADSSPIRISAQGIVYTRIDMNGKLLKRRNKTPVRVELSPIPNTRTDALLKQTLLYARSDSPFAKDAETISEMTINLGSSEDSFGDYLILTDGYPVDGGIGMEVVAEGRFASLPYIFEFADIEGKIHTSVYRGDYETPEEGDESPSDSESNPKSSNAPEKRPKMRYRLQGPGFRPRTTIGTKAMESGLKTPSTTNKWYS